MGWLGGSWLGLLPQGEGGLMLLRCRFSSRWPCIQLEPACGLAAASPPPRSLPPALLATGLSINTGGRAQGFPAAAAGVPTPVEVFARFPQVGLPAQRQGQGRQVAGAGGGG